MRYSSDILVEQFKWINNQQTNNLIGILWVWIVIQTKSMEHTEHTLASNYSHGQHDIALIEMIVAV
jgi:hypothetical protein